MDAAGTLDFGTFMTRYGTCLQSDCPRLHVFGYGSLMWKPGFEYNSYSVGYVENYERRFNQGNQTFRGTKDKPGRVANLEEKQGCKVWGLAYEVCGKEEVTEVLQNLYHREIASGSYKVTMTSFYPRKCKNISNNARCCSQSHHNIPLPHPACGVPKRDNSQIISPTSLSKPHPTSAAIQSPCCSMDQQQPSPASLSLSWLVSYTSMCQSKPEAVSDCPCYLQTCSDSFSVQTRNVNSHNRRSISHHVGEFSRHSHSHHASVENIKPSVKIEHHLTTRKASLDVVNHTKLNSKHSYRQTTPIIRHLSIDFHNLSLESHASKLHSNKTKEHNSFARPRMALREIDLNAVSTQSEDNSEADESPLHVLLFTVTKQNDQYLGPDEVDTMAEQIIQTGGTAGTNVEYVLKISDFIKTFIPEDDDQHLFCLDDKIRKSLFLHAQEEGETEKMNILQPGSHNMPTRINS